MDNGKFCLENAFRIKNWGQPTRKGRTLLPESEEGASPQCDGSSLTIRFAFRTKAHISSFLSDDLGLASFSVMHWC